MIVPRHINIIPAIDEGTSTNIAIYGTVVRAGLRRDIPTVIAKSGVLSLSRIGYSGPHNETFSGEMQSLCVPTEYRTA